jgi:hypothetical protein
MTADIPSLIHKLRNAPQLVGTFGRGDPDPLDEYRPGMTGEERDWLIKLAEQAQTDSVSPSQKDEMLAFFLAYFDEWPFGTQLTLTNMAALERAREKVAKLSCQVGKP